VRQPSIVVKVQRPRDGNGTEDWIVCDQPRSLNRLISPASLPQHVRRALDVETYAFFHAKLDEPRVVFGLRFVGDPGWL